MYATIEVREYTDEKNCKRIDLIKVFPQINEPHDEFKIAIMKMDNHSKTKRKYPFIEYTVKVEP